VSERFTGDPQDDFHQNSIKPFVQVKIDVFRMKGAFFARY
jgi:hypothetical protein